MEKLNDTARVADGENFPGICDAIYAAGHHIEQRFPGGEWWCDDLQAVTAIIDAYDPVPVFKAREEESIKARALADVQAVFPVVKTFEQLDLEAERWASLGASAKETTAKYQQLLDIHAQAKADIEGVKAAATIADVRALRK